MHRSEDGDVEAKLARIEQTSIAGDVALFLQSPHTPQTGRRRNSDALGQFHIGDPAIGLDLAQDFEVDFVKILGHGARGAGGNKRET